MTSCASQVFLCLLTIGVAEPPPCDAVLPPGTDNLGHASGSVAARISRPDFVDPRPVAAIGLPSRSVVAVKKESDSIIAAHPDRVPYDWRPGPDKLPEEAVQ